MRNLGHGFFPVRVDQLTAVSKIVGYVASLKPLTAIGQHMSSPACKSRGRVNDLKFIVKVKPVLIIGIEQPLYHHVN
jgi:hypothetical protein